MIIIRARKLIHFTFFVKNFVDNTFLAENIFQ